MKEIFIEFSNRSKNIQLKRFMYYLIIIKQYIKDLAAQMYSLKLIAQIYIIIYIS